ncbi:MAG: hypothetical protein P8I55_06150 [Crocinitomix sp.]|nr:hypothetical protein [Crocinitomix sp.]
MRYLVLLLLFPFISHAQNLDNYNQERLKLTENLMVGLGSWSVANMGVSGVGWATTDNEAKYFHQMNVMWSGVNMIIAFPSYFKAKKTDPKGISFSETWRTQHIKEKVFLFNTALDLVYVSGGVYLKQRALVDANNYQRYRGWGNSLIMQGGFLFILDLTATILHTKHRKNKLQGFWDKMDAIDLGLSANGIGLQIHL